MLNSAELALGTAQIGMPYGIANKDGQPDEQQSLALLHRALECGVRIFDTARAYGDSERIIGECLAKAPRPPQIVTKLPPIRQEAAADSHSQDNLRRHVERHLTISLNALRLDRIDYYLVHDEEDLAGAPGRLLEVLWEFKTQGLVGKVGISAYSVEMASQAIDTGLVESIQVPVNLLDHRFGGILQRCQSAGITVFARSVFLQGLFFLSDEEVVRSLPAARDYLNELRGLSRSTQRTIEELAICFVRDNPAVGHVVIGMESTEQLETNLKLMDQPRLEESLRIEICRLFRNIPDSVVNPAQWRLGS